MIKELCERWEKKKVELFEKYSEKHPDSYESIVRDVVSLFSDDSSPIRLDPERITVIDHGQYQGTLLFVIGEEGYQPERYYSIFVNYGSCGGCDTFQRIKYDFDEDGITSQTELYMRLALHLFQSLTPIGGDK